MMGARQVGKTTLVKQILAKAECRSKYFNCDILSLRESFSREDPIALKRFIGDYDLIVLDEAQRVKNIALNLKILHDHFPKLQIIATGSSSFELSSSVHEPLTGRAFDYTLFPLSYEEIAQKNDYSDRMATLEQYLRFGAYPDVFLQADEASAIKLLEVISSNYLYRDVLEFKTIKHADQLVKLLQLLALQIGREVSYHELGQKLGMNNVTVQRYLDLLEKSYVVFHLKAFSRNLRNEISKGMKVFFWDLGIRNALIRNFNPLELRDDVGQLWENFWIAERLKYLNNTQELANVYFWRTYTQQEIDFLEEKDGKLSAYECKWKSKKSVSIPTSFSKAYPGTDFHLITPADFESTLIHKP